MNRDELYDKSGTVSHASTAFKKCMKGRCGCGGSSFPRARISCDDVATCGPCGFFDPAGGCSAFGARIWYCQQPNSDACSVCADTVFHELAHACGQLDDPDCGGAKLSCPVRDPDEVDGSCHVGRWFGEQCCMDPQSAGAGN